MKPNSFLRHFLSIASSSLLCISFAHAADVTWDITPGTVGVGNGSLTGGSGVWNTSTGNWTTNGGVNNRAWVNANNDTAIFGGTVGTGTITLGTGITVGKLIFNTPNYSIAGGTLTFGTAGNITANVNATIRSVVAGSAITKTGTGTLTLFGNNSYTGTMTVSAGTLSIGDGITNGTLGSSYRINSPGALRVRYNGAGVPASWTATTWNNFTGNGTLALATGKSSDGWGDAALRSDFTGTLQIQGGRVATSPVAGGGFGGARAIRVLAGGQLTDWRGSAITQNLTIAGTGYGEGGLECAIRMSGGTSPSVLSGLVSLSASATIGANSTGILTNVISGTAGSTLTVGTWYCNGKVILAADNTYAGATTIAAGTLQIGNGGATGTLGAGAVTNNGTLVFNRSGALNLAQAITGSGAVSQEGSGTVTLTGANNYLGATTVSAGTLAIGDGITNGTLGSLYRINSPGTLRIRYNTSGVQSSWTDTIWNNFTGNGTLALATGKSSEDWRNAALPSNFTGTLQIEGGRVGTDSVTGNGFGNATAIRVLAGGQLMDWRGSSITQDLTIAGTGYGESAMECAIRMGENATPTILSGLVNLSGNVTIGARGTGILTNVISGAAGSTLTVGTPYSNGNVIFTGANNYLGATTVSAGTLSIGDGITNSTLGSSYQINSPGTLRIRYNTSGVQAAWTQTNWNNFTGNGTLALATGKSSDGWGTAALTGNFTGTLQIEGGRVGTDSVAGSGFGNATAINVLAGGQLTDWRGSAITQNLTIAGTGYGEGGLECAIRMSADVTPTILSGLVNLSANATIAANSTGILTNVISGAAGSTLTVGTWYCDGNVIFTGANNYLGATTINAGTLTLGRNGALPAGSAVSIGDATLNAGNYSNSGGTLEITLGAEEPARIVFGSGGTLAFADSSSLFWADFLQLGGNFVSGASMRVGTTSGGLSRSQLQRIIAPGFSGFSLNDQGYVTATAHTAPNFDSWQMANGTSQSFSEDLDGDGVTNGIEYFLHGTSDSSSADVFASVTSSAGNASVTWTKASTYPGTYGTNFVVQTSSTSASGPWINQTAGSSLVLNGNSLTYNFPAGAETFVRLVVNETVQEAPLAIDTSKGIPLRSHRYRQDMFAVSLLGNAIKPSNGDPVYEIFFDTGSTQTCLPYGVLNRANLTVEETNIRVFRNNLADKVRGQLLIKSKDGVTNYTLDNFTFYAMKNDDGTDMPDDRTLPYGRGIIGAFPFMGATSFVGELTTKYSTNGLGSGIISESPGGNLVANWRYHRSYLKFGNDPAVAARLNWTNWKPWHTGQNEFDPITVPGFKISYRFPAVSGQTYPDLVIPNRIATIDTGAGDLVMQLGPNNPHLQAPYSQFFNTARVPPWYGPAVCRALNYGVDIDVAFTGSTGKTISYSFPTADWNGGFIPNVATIGNWDSYVPWTLNTVDMPTNRMNLGNSIYFFCKAYYWDFTNQRIGFFFN